METFTLLQHNWSDHEQKIKDTKMNLFEIVPSSEWKKLRRNLGRFFKYKRN